MKLIVGLGNPGKAYTDNRHNIGFRCINYFAKNHRIPLSKRQCRAQIGSGRVAGNEVVLAKPCTLMNLSGESALLLVQKFQVPLSDLIVIHDDLDLPLGKIRLRYGGSSGGHKGVGSIITYLGSQDFPRIRLGIGRPSEATGVSKSSEEAVISYVLSDFSPTEREVIEKAIARVSDTILCLLTEGMIVAMNKYNFS